MPDKGAERGFRALFPCRTLSGKRWECYDKPVFLLSGDAVTLESGLEDTLAWTVLSDYERYIGVASPKLFAQFLYGAWERAKLTGARIPEWRIFGPLEEERFYLPIVARTGHPSMNIKWACAFAMLHFSMSEAMAQLAKDIDLYVRTYGVSADKRTEPYCFDTQYADGFISFLRIVAGRPGMWGLTGGASLHCWLAGMSIGGDWLELPPLPGLRETTAKIEALSMEYYGSPFASYRVYDHGVESVRHLLQWAGIEPLETTPGAAGM